MVRSHSNEDYNSTHNSSKTVDTFLKIWSAKIDCIRQCATVCRGRISRILQEKWNSTHPYCTLPPASNVLEERGVQTLKRGYMKLSRGTAKDCVARFVLQYAITPHTNTGCCPSELLFVRKLRTHLDTVKRILKSF